MPDSVYKVITLVGTSTEVDGRRRPRLPWTGRVRLCGTCESRRSSNWTCSSTTGKVEAYRAKVRVSFKFEGEK